MPTGIRGKEAGHPARCTVTAITNPHKSGMAFLEASIVDSSPCSDPGCVICVYAYLLGGQISKTMAGWLMAYAAASSFVVVVFAMEGNNP